MMQAETLNPQLLNEVSAMRYLSLSRKALRRLRDDGILQAIEVGRSRYYAVADLELGIRWLRAHPNEMVTQDVDEMEARFK